MAYQIQPALLARLPRTFLPALNEQLRNWDLLFPVEKRTLIAQMDWLGRLPEPAFRAIFEPIVALERQMNLPPWNETTERLSVGDTSVLVRSPNYPQWRAAVESAFEKIDAGVQSARSLQRHNKLLVCVMPPGLAAPAGPLWPGLEAHGRWISLTAPFSDALPVLFSSVAEREMTPAIEPVERTFVFEYDGLLSAIRTNAAASCFSFEDLGPLRREFLIRLNAMNRDLRTLDRTYDQLRHQDLRRWLAHYPDAVVSEFVRNLFLSGNGALLFGNSFVQWGASEAFRRAAPQATFCRFGIRPKLKPFSSVVLFEDQQRANPVPDKPDPEGSFVDAQLLMEYVYLSALRGPEYVDRMFVLFALPEQSRVLALGRSDAMDLPQPAYPADLSAACRAWLARGGA